MSIERFFWSGIDSLAFYDQRTFARYVGVEFTAHVGAERVSITLTSLTDILPAGADRTNGREFFHLRFETDAGADPLAAGVYVLEHRELGVFELLLAPRRTDLFEPGEVEGEEEETEPVIVSTDTNLYRAIVYRLAYSAMGSLPAQTTDWPVHASRFNYESGFGPLTILFADGEYIIEGEGIEEVEEE